MHIGMVPIKDGSDDHLTISKDGTYSDKANHLDIHIGVVTGRSPATDGDHARRGGRSVQVSLTRVSVRKMSLTWR